MLCRLHPGQMVHGVYVEQWLNMTMDSLALSFPAKVNHNTGDAELIELAVAGAKAALHPPARFAVETGVHTGRSVQDKFIVRDAATEKRSGGTTTSR